jgi:hypothetical protein
MRNKFMVLIILYLLSSLCMAQNKLENNFYAIKVPEKTTFKSFNSTHEEYANIEGYQFFLNDKLKYMIYLMSNKMLGEVEEINKDNYQEFCGDIGAIEVSEIKEDNDMVRLLFKYTDQEKVRGIIYLKLTNNILDRFLFLLPNDKAYELFNKEIDDIVKSIIYKKNIW